MVLIRIVAVVPIVAVGAAVVITLAVNGGEVADILSSSLCAVIVGVIVVEVEQTAFSVVVVVVMANHGMMWIEVAA